MKYTHAWATLACAALFSMLSACGGGGNGNGTGNGGGAAPAPTPTPTRGALLREPAQTAAFTPAALSGRLQNGLARDQTLLLLAGEPVCSVDVRSLQYTTLGGANEATSASGVLMLPGGNDSRCTGARPIVLYAHATDPAKTYNLAAMGDASNAAANESNALAALFAARGYIVVAPNYAGYDVSPLPYHPFLNAQQQSGEMMDVLTAAKTAIAGLGTRVTAGSRLFITGYSQGGHVAMATHRAMQAAGITVTASAPMSGPYALAKELDDNFAGQVHVGATLFGTLIANSFQKSYANVYANPSELYEPEFASGIETLLPGASASTLASTGKLPSSALFSPVAPTAGASGFTQAQLNAATPPAGTAMDSVYARGFAASHLFTNSFRLAYLQDAALRPNAPTFGLRVDARTNDLRGWNPASPVLLCGGADDATVSFTNNTLAVAQSWSSLPAGRVSLINMDQVAPDAFAAERAGFALLKEATVAQARLQGLDTGWEVARNYHAALFPFCASAAKKYFDGF